jgi:hypothetical protein
MVIIIDNFAHFLIFGNGVGG